MTIRDGEIGRDYFVSTTFDLSAFTELTIRFTSPDGTISFSKTTADGVSAPAVPSPAIPDLGILPASTYMKYTTDGTEFIAGGTPGGKGDWTVCTEYQDATPKLFYGDDTTLIVGESCT